MSTKTVKITIILIAQFLFFVVVPSLLRGVFAATEIEAEESLGLFAAPFCCGTTSLMGIFSGIMTLSVLPFMLLIPLAMIFGLAVLAFNILMIVDCVNRDFKDRQLWLVILIAGLLLGYGLIASLLYYFLVKKEDL